jgi:Iron-containing redox enzyme
MTSASPGLQATRWVRGASLRWRTECIVDEVLASLPKPELLSADQRRGIIARYAAVLEGNFIYWMTGAYLSVRTEEARSIVLENLREEVRDCHPGMMRKFAVAAHAAPTQSDFRAVSAELTNVRLFVGRLSAGRLLLMMAFFESFIQRFMIFLAELGDRQGSIEQEYTQVHGVCDIAHTEGLFRALAVEMGCGPLESEADLFEGVDLLRALIQTIVHPGATQNSVGALPI